MKIYTKTGDDATTGLFGGSRVKKHHIRIESYGTLDELNSWLGLIRDQPMDPHYKKILLTIQDRLFTLGAILATDPEKAILKNGKDRLNIPGIGIEDLLLLENEIDAMEASLPPMTHFILPGGHPTVSYFHIARTVCRRADRSASLHHEKEPLERPRLYFLNRLSDYLIVL